MRPGTSTMTKKECEYIKVCGACWDSIPVRDSDFYGEKEFVLFVRGISNAFSVLLKHPKSNVRCEL